MKNKKLIVVCGPTAVGKTEKAISLAQKHNTCIISADSRQVYRELDIGVARPSPAELKAAEHHFIACVSIKEEYNAGTYAKEARILINSLFDKQDTLIICGGTGLYIRAVLKGLDPLPPKNEILRTELNAALKENGLEALQKKLLESDAERYYKTDISNPQRLIRAIEIASAETPVKSDIPEFTHPFETEIMLIETGREHLYERINKRVDKMISSGLENEARNLYEYRHLNALQSVGYSEWWPYFEGESDKDTVIEKIKQHSRNYAKRQMTWFRNQF